MISQIEGKNPAVLLESPAERLPIVRQPEQPMENHKWKAFAAAIIIQAHLNLFYFEA